MSEALSTLKKTNPLGLLLIVAMAVLAGRILYSSLPLEHKALLFVLSISLALVVCAFETYRISWQEELEEEALRRRLFGG